MSMDSRELGHLEDLVDECEELNFACRDCKEWFPSAVTERLVTNDQYKEIVHFCEPCAKKRLETEKDKWI